MELYEVFEVAMLLCFSIGWYWSIARMLRVRVASGKSRGFVLCVCTGYLCGVAAKLMIWGETGDLSPLVWLYGWNMMVVGFDLALVLYFSRVSRRAPPVRATVAV